METITKVNQKVLEEKVYRLARLLKIAQQTILAYHLRHSDEKQLLNGYRNDEVRKMIADEFTQNTELKDTE